MSLLARLGVEKLLIIDTHCHAGRNWFEPIETLLFEMDTNGVSHAMLIQHGGVYDHDYLFECAERFSGRFKVVIRMDPEDPNQPATLTRLKERGAAGVRLTPDERASRGDPLSVWKAAGELSMVVSCQGDMDRFAAPEFRELLEACPDTQIVIEHLAGVRRASPPYDSFKRAAETAKHPNTFIKVPGLGEIASRPPRLLPEFRFDDVPPVLEEACKAFGPRRMMWGSDFPGLAGREGYRNAIAGIRDYSAFQRGDDIEWVLGRTAAIVWGFPQ